MPARSPFMRIAIGGAVPKGPRWVGAPEAGPAPGGRSEGRQPVRFLNRKGKKWPSVNRDMERLILQFCCGFDDMWGLYLLSMMLIVQSWLFDCLLLVFVFPLRLFLLFPFVLFARLRNSISFQSCGRAATLSNSAGRGWYKWGYFCQKKSTSTIETSADLLFVIRRISGLIIIYQAINGDQQVWESLSWWQL